MVMADDKELEFRAHVDRCTTTMHNHLIYLSEGDIYYRVYFHHCNVYNNAMGSDKIEFNECVFHGCRYFRDDVEVSNVLEMFALNELQIDNLSRERCLNMERSMYDPVAERLSKKEQT